MKVPMATTNLFGDPVFRDGAFTSNDARVRALRAAEDDARDRPRRRARRRDVRVLGRTRGRRDQRRQGSAGSAQVVPRRAQLPLRVRRSSQGYELKFALEPKPNEPRGDIFLPTIGHMLAFIYTLDHPDMVGLNPEVAHDTMAGLDFSHGVAQALEAGQALPHRPQRPEARSLRPGPALRQRGPEGRVLPREAARGREVARHAALRQPRLSHRRRARRVGLRRAAACARTSSSRKRSARFNADPEIQGLLERARARAAPSAGQRVQVHADGRARELKERSLRPRRRCARRATRTSGSIS